MVQSLYRIISDFGHKEGRKPHPLFNPIWYLDNNPDVEKAGLDRSLITSTLDLEKAKPEPFI